jgi:hypothetical protein|tara:strand:+ start:2982 stop:3191 length:210 start_codon:yes stop_codon:yes gene_type:complete
MALTDAQVAAAKAEAKEYLEYSTQVLCLALGVDPATVTASYTNPETSGTEFYVAHECLRKQLAALGALA